MSGIDLSQMEADALFAMEKHRADDQERSLPGLGDKVSVPLVSPDRREGFLLDISRGRIDLARGKYQNRARQTIVLARLDFGGAPHRNPDDTEVPVPHLHLYREGFGDKWAVPVPVDRFPNVEDRWQLLLDFMDFCNVTMRPLFRRGLFT